MQQVTGTYLYYKNSNKCNDDDRLWSMTVDQVALTEKTMEKTLYFLDYVTSHTDASVSYTASTMVLVVHSDTVYLTDLKASIWADG